jgi:hypothetical protein
METRRLRALQAPAEVERMLEQVVLTNQLLPKGCHPLRDVSALPAPLQAVLERAAEEGRAWACWASNFDTYLFTCEMSLSLSRERGVPVLLVQRYGERGELQEAGSWASYSEGKWTRIES